MSEIVKGENDSMSSRGLKIIIFVSPCIVTQLLHQQNPPEKDRPRSTKGTFYTIWRTDSVNMNFVQEEGYLLEWMWYYGSILHSVEKKIMHSELMIHSGKQCSFLFQVNAIHFRMIQTEGMWKWKSVSGSVRERRQGETFWNGPEYCQSESQDLIYNEFMCLICRKLQSHVSWTQSTVQQLQLSEGLWTCVHWNNCKALQVSWLLGHIYWWQHVSKFKYEFPLLSSVIV